MLTLPSNACRVSPNLALGYLAGLAECPQVFPVANRQPPRLSKATRSHGYKSPLPPPRRHWYHIHRLRCPRVQEPKRLQAPCSSQSPQDSKSHCFKRHLPCEEKANLPFSRLRSQANLHPRYLIVYHCNNIN